MKHKNNLIKWVVYIAIAALIFTSLAPLLYGLT